MKRHRALGLALFAAACGAASTASAQTACPANAVVIRGSSASEPIINKVAVLAKAQGIDIVYNSSQGSCAGVNSLIPANGGTTLTTPSGRTKYDQANQNATCNLAAPREADIGVSDIYSTSCSSLGGPATPDTVLDRLGPVQVFTLAVYADPSFPVVISAEAGFNIFGITARKGDGSFNVDPWTVSADILARNETSGTQQIWARALGLPITKFAAAENDQGSSGSVLSKINSSPRNSIIGIIALNDIVSSGTPPVQPNVRPLAFKAKDQDFGYYPSSTSTAADLINVRDGHYAPWANLHFLTKKGSDGKAADPKVQAILDLLETQDAVSTISSVRAVPACAMQVSRSSDMGDFSAYKPAKPCGCFFEKTVGAPASASCSRTCSDDAGCDGATQQCVYGFCEAK